MRVKLIIPIIYYQGQRKWKKPHLQDLFKKYPKSIKGFWITYFFWGLTHKKSKDQQLVNRFIAFFHDKNM